MENKNQIRREILYKSLIGKKIKITKSKIKNQINFEGILIWETQNYFVFENKKNIFKKNIFFEIEVDEKKFEVDGKLLINKLEKRIKKMK